MNFNLSLVNSIESDLRSLSLQNRRKFPDLVNAAEHAVLNLRQYQSSLEYKSGPSTSADSSEPSSNPLHSDSIVRPFLLACATKQPKLIVVALSGIQKLLSATPTSQHFLELTMGTLRIQAESDDAQVKLKILQTLLLAISPNTAESDQLSQSALLQGLSVCFRLFGNSDPIIHNTAFAALRQAISLLFERVERPIREEWRLAGFVPRVDPSGRPILSLSANSINSSNPAELSAESKNALLLFRDLCVLSKGGSEGARWLTMTSRVPPKVGLELIEAILGNHQLLLYV
jgi:hypothetical protein